MSKVKRFWFYCLVSNSNRKEVPLEHSRELYVLYESKKKLELNLLKRFKHVLVVKRIGGKLK